MKKYFLFQWLILAMWMATPAWSHTSLTYNNHLYQFSIQYPRSAEVKETFVTAYLLNNQWRYDDQTNLGKALLSISLPVKSNADRAITMVRIGVSAAKSDLAICIKGAKKTKVIHGVAFSVFPFSDAGMMKQLQGVSYRTIYHDKCYAIEQILTYSVASLANTNERNNTIKSLNKTYQYLWAIIKTFRFI